MTRIFFSAGDSSGDLHGANLILALRKAEPSIVCEGLGGERMAAAGMGLHYDLAGEGIMGFTEVVKSFRLVRRLFRETEQFLRENGADCVVLIDYPGFNIQLAKRAKAMGIPVIYYISPQVWAWKKGRIQTLARLVEKMLVILPFEEELYTNAGVDCTFVGHPLLDCIPPGDKAQTNGRSQGGLPQDLVVGLMPGSRAQEIDRLLAPMIEVAKGLQARFPGARFVTPCVDTAREQQVRRLAGGFPLEILVGGSYALLRMAQFCIVASGTATLETALFGVPMVIVYRVSWLSYHIARLLVDLDYIGIANILEGRCIIPEFIQGDVRTDAILPAAIELIEDTPRRRQILEDLRDVRAKLGAPGASARCAAQIMEVVNRCRQRRDLEVSHG